ncbi:hypothetical protein GCM10010428_21310 [Actinosynnema pretiosum subsp. pretiosum]
MAAALLQAADVVGGHAGQFAELFTAQAPHPSAAFGEPERGGGCAFPQLAHGVTELLVFHVLESAGGGVGWGGKGKS